MKITKQTVVRAMKTFIQTALSYIIVNAVCVNFTGDKLNDITALRALMMSAIAAGIAGAMNLEKEVQQ